MFFIPLPIVILEVLAFTTFLHFFNFWDVFLGYLLPSFLGAVMFSLTGRSMMMAMQVGFAQGQLPGDRMLHRGAILLGSIFLIIPMFTTRVLAVFLILPLFRHLSVFIFKTYIFKRLSNSRFSFVRGFPGGFGGTQAGGFGGARTYSNRGPFPFEEEARHERDAEVVNVTPLEITHTKIVDEETPKKKDDSSES
ncbi:FxsA family protein [Bdellovibrio sp. HCB337]|uniref:FxsA family protein n=1 Tax=Bdellovibrio sp. HCB337 TaxID=3394358 RepID=UPI0039A5C3D8